MPKSRRRIYLERFQGAWTHTCNLEKFLTFMVEPLTRAGKKEELEFISVALQFIAEIKEFIRHLHNIVAGEYPQLEGYIVDSSPDRSECEGDTVQ